MPHPSMQSQLGQGQTAMEEELARLRQQHAQVRCRESVDAGWCLAAGPAEGMYLLGVQPAARDTSG